MWRQIETVLIGDTVCSRVQVIIILLSGPGELMTCRESRYEEKSASTATWGREIDAPELISKHCNIVICKMGEFTRFAQRKENKQCLRKEFNVDNDCCLKSVYTRIVIVVC